MKRRDFFAVLGGGIVVLMDGVLLDDEIYAQETGGPRRGGGGAVPVEIGAWLHIGETGVVTVYTGKVEVGQNARTSLTQAVVEELHAPPGSVTMVMGDTELTPFDMGTVGSMTTPRMWPQIRRAGCSSIWRRGSGAWIGRRSPSRTARCRRAAARRASANWRAARSGRAPFRRAYRWRRPRRGRCPGHRCPRSTGATSSPARTSTRTT